MEGRREIGYRRDGDVGVLTFDLYNGAMSTGQCRRLTSALRHAVAQDTKVLVIRSGDVFSNGIHLNVIHAAPSPAMEAWRNINAIDDVCREIIGCTSQLVVTSLRGSAGAGGVMMALGADQVIARDGVVLNPHYQTMGLYGSEYWTYVLPRRVGPDRRDRPHPAVPARSEQQRQHRSGSSTRCCPVHRPPSTSGCSSSPDSWPGVATTGDCSTRSGRHELPTSSANRSTPTAPRSSPR